MCGLLLFVGIIVGLILWMRYEDSKINTDF
jgi:hypothetical protein